MPPPLIGDLAARPRPPPNKRGLCVPSPPRGVDHTTLITGFASGCPPLRSSRLTVELSPLSSGRIPHLLGRRRTRRDTVRHRSANGLTWRGRYEVNAKWSMLFKHIFLPSLASEQERMLRYVFLTARPVSLQRPLMVVHRVNVVGHLVWSTSSMQPRLSP